MPDDPTIDYQLQAELLDHVGQAVFVVDAENRVTYWNQAASEIFGWSWEEVRGASVGEKIVPPRRAHELEQVRTAVQRDGVWKGEMQLVAKDGREVVILGTVVLTRSPPGSRIAAGTDVTELRRAQRQLSEQRALLETVVASAPLVLFALDAQGRYTLSEGKGLSALGLAPGELVGTSALDRYRDLPELADDVRRALGGEGFRAVRQFAGRTYETFWSPFGTGEGTIGVSVDVTGQARAEEEQERLLALLDSTPDFVGIATAEQDVTYVNPAGRRMVGLGLDASLDGVRIDDFHPPAAMKRLRDEAFPAASAKGTWSGESALRRADGGEIPVWQVVVAHHSDTGEIEFVSTIASDLTEWHEASDQLHFQAGLLDAVGQSVIATDLGGRVTFWNRAAEELYGWTADEAKGMSILDLTPAEPARRRGEEVLAALRRGGRWSGEFALRRKDGTVFPGLVTNAPIRDETGALVGIVGVSSDLSERKALEVELAQAQKMDAVGRLAGGIAHDFNNLLTVIEMHTQILLAGPEASPDQRADFREIRSAARRAAELTRQLLAFSRKQVLEEQIVDLRAEIGGMRTMLRRLIPERITLEVDLGDAPTMVNADPTQVQQVLLNLVVNAVDALEDHGVIEVRVDRTTLSDEDVQAIPWRVAPGDYARLTVHDSGTGMSEPVMERIFEPFFTTKELGKGTGLGLASVYGIVKQSGGHVFVESAEGAGATFRVLLPAADGDSGAAGQNERAAPEETDGRTHAGTVLVVEDDPAVRNVAVRVLRSAGYEVVTAANGLEALEQVERQGDTIRLVVTDLVMPVMGGIELTRELGRRRPELPVVLASGYPREESGLDVAELGAAFLAKPFTVSDLLGTVRRALDR